MSFALATMPARVTVEAYEELSGNGERLYGAPMLNVPARIVRRRKALRTGSDTAVICDTQIDIRPEHGPLPEESRITFGTQVYYVQACEDAMDLTRIEGYRLACTGPGSSQ